MFFLTKSRTANWIFPVFDNDDNNVKTRLNDNEFHKMVLDYNLTFKDKHEDDDNKYCNTDIGDDATTTTKR